MMRMLAPLAHIKEVDIQLATAAEAKSKRRTKHPIQPLHLPFLPVESARIFGPGPGRRGRRAPLGVGKVGSPAVAARANRTLRLTI